MHELNLLIEALRPEWVREERSAWETAVAETALFSTSEEHRFRHAERLDADTIVGRVASVSAIAVASPEDQARTDELVHVLVGDGEVDFPMITTVLVADRV
jgi:ribonuclease PH